MRNPDDVRGFAGHNQRVDLPTAHDWDRVQCEAEPAPWHATFPQPGADDRPEHLAALREFLRQLCRLSSEEREIVFLRLADTPWATIPAMMAGFARRVLDWNGHTGAAMESRFYRTLKANPSLRFAFPDREKK